MKISKRKIILLIITASFIGLILIIYKIDNSPDTFFPEENKTLEIVFSPGIQEIILAGRVRSQEQTSITSEISSKIVDVLVKEGDEVKKGDILVRLENINQRLQVKNAQISVNSAQLYLNKLLNNNSTNDNGSVISRVSSQQDKTIEIAKNAYLNADLRAYPEDDDENSKSPQIVGNYNCNVKGFYTINVYSSSANSGASIYVSGLESDRISVSTDYSIPFGSCGLEIIFDIDFKKNKTWIIPVPNVRSSEYIALKKQYENTLSAKELAVKTNTILPEDISAARDKLSQAQLSLELAQIQLVKTKIKAPFDGVVTKVFSDTGNLASAYKPLLEINSSGFEIITDISPEFIRELSSGDIVIVEINDSNYDIVLENIIQQSQEGSQKIPLRFGFLDTLPEDIFDGMFVEIPLSFEQSSTLFIPSDFIGFGYDGPFVNCSGEESPVDIRSENEEGYWIEFTNSRCDDEILYPQLLVNN